MVPSARPPARPRQAVSTPSVLRSYAIDQEAGSQDNRILMDLGTSPHARAHTRPYTRMHACARTQARARTLTHACTRMHALSCTRAHRTALRCRAHARAAAHHADRRVRRGALHNCKARRPAARASQGTPASPGTAASPPYALSRRSLATTAGGSGWTEKRTSGGARGSRPTPAARSVFRRSGTRTVWDAACSMFHVALHVACGMFACCVV